MEDIKLFVRFLKLVQKYFKDEQEIGFYAGKLGITPKKLSRIISEISDSSLPEWIDVMKKNSSEKYNLQNAC